MAPLPYVEPPRIDLTALEASASANPRDADIRLRLGWGYYGAGRLDRAEGAFQEARRLLPDDPEPYFALGLTFKKVGKAAEAVSAFRDASQRTSHLKDKARAAILRRLSLGHINFLERGEWDLEREVWGRA
jgi:cytochrome c-type biogenesis protein CcmH/NrfG